MSCWCCIRGPLLNSAGDHQHDEKPDLESVGLQKINDFVAEVFADAVKKFSVEQGMDVDSVQDELFVDDPDKSTRDFSHMASWFYNTETDDTFEDDLGEDRATRQRISQILDMGVYQPGISFVNRDSATDSDPESDSGISLAASLQQNPREESNEVRLKKKSVGVKRFSTLSNPLPEKVLLEDGGHPETQRRFSIFSLQEDANHCQQAIMNRRDTEIRSSVVSADFLDNMC